MRLLYHDDQGEILIKEFPGDKDVPPYAILSHTWGAEEVSLEDLTDGSPKNKSGYQKITFCGNQARRDGLEYFWVDTCCISDKEIEVQRAINSMYRWYKRAKKCYVYLADVSKETSSASRDSNHERWQLAFRNSRWFTRGWTLQELIAPKSVEFFSNEGLKLGNKRSLEGIISQRTGIPSTALRGNPLNGFSVFERISWMEGRNTMWDEDKAYSLLGIFGVYMGMIYGEGEENAFRRLHDEIDKASEREAPERVAYQPECYKCWWIDMLKINGS